MAKPPLHFPDRLVIAFRPGTLPSNWSVNSVFNTIQIGRFLKLLSDLDQNPGISLIQSLDRRAQQDLILLLPMILGLAFRRPNESFRQRLVRVLEDGLRASFPRDEGPGPWIAPIKFSFSPQALRRALQRIQITFARSLSEKELDAIRQRIRNVGSIVELAEKVPFRYVQPLESSSTPISTDKPKPKRGGEFLSQDYLPGWQLKILAKPNDLQTPVNIAVLDTGADLSHAELAGRANSGFIGYIADLQGHCTHVVSTMLKLLATGSTVWVYKVTDSDPVTFDGKTYYPVDPVLYNTALSTVAENPFDAVNLSIGGEAPMSRWEASGIGQLLTNATPVIAASGNDGSNPLFPAAYHGVISVGAGIKRDSVDHGVEVWYLSNDVSASYGCVAPGFNIWGAMPLAKPRANGTQYVQKEAYMSGTSMAAPQVTAVIAAGRQSYLKLNDAKRSGRGLIQFNRLKGST